MGTVYNRVSGAFIKRTGDEQRESKILLPDI